jgi:hypothetical protein
MDVSFNPDTLIDDAGRIVDQRQKERKPMKPEERRRAMMAQLTSTAFSLRLRTTSSVWCRNIMPPIARS